MTRLFLPTLLSILVVGATLLGPSFGGSSLLGPSSASAQNMDLGMARMDQRDARMDLRMEVREARMDLRDARMDLREAIRMGEGVMDARMELREERREGRMDIRDARMDLREAGMELSQERRERNRERREARREARRRHWSRVIRWNPALANGERPPAVMIGEARRHAWRVARLTRVRSLAMAAEDAAAVTRVDSLIARENARHEARVRRIGMGGAEVEVTDEGASVGTENTGVQVNPAGVMIQLSPESLRAISPMIEVNVPAVTVMVNTGAQGTE